MSKYELGDRVQCVKDFEKLKVANTYSINRCVDLTMNAGTNLSGFGYCIEHYEITSIPMQVFMPVDSSSPYASYLDKIEWYYFTEEMMDEYFISEEESYKAWLRNDKIKQIIND
jgi:hypothetical protein